LHTITSPTTTTALVVRSAFKAGSAAPPLRWLTLLAVLACVFVPLAISSTASAEDDIDWLPAISLNVDVPYQLVGGTATLTAKADFINIPSSPYLIRIYDATTKTLLKDCKANTCSVAVTKTQEMTRTYRAFIAKSGTGFPPPEALPGWSFQGPPVIDVSWSSLTLRRTRFTGHWLVNVVDHAMAA